MIRWLSNTTFQHFLIFIVATFCGIAMGYLVTVAEHHNSLGAIHWLVPLIVLALVFLADRRSHSYIRICGLLVGYLSALSLFFVLLVNHARDDLTASRLSSRVSKPPVPDTALIAVGESACFSQARCTYLIENLPCTSLSSIRFVGPAEIHYYGCLSSGVSVDSKATSHMTSSEMFFFDRSVGYLASLDSVAVTCASSVLRYAQLIFYHEGVEYLRKDLAWSPCYDASESDTAFQRIIGIADRRFVAGRR